MKHRVMEYSVEHPRVVFILTALLVLLSALFIPRITIDTDPENMLPASNPARVIHDEIKQRFGLSDMIVLGIVNQKDPNGIYNPTTLQKLHSLSVAIAGIEGVVRDDLMSLQTSDNITQNGPGEISFHWMMETPPANQEEANRIAEAVARLPMLQNTLVSGDNKAAGIYIPITAKKESYRVATEIQQLLDGLEKGDDEFHITGLPVAEDTFGIEMFKQMAISAPAAGLLIFLLMLYFFRSAPLVMAPMMVAMATVIITMGALIGAGYPVHIMSSMIPIFLMPIAVVDSVHMLSEFSDRYRPGMDKKVLAKEMVNHLFQPMLFTSITSIVGFASLNTADIPPVQVFGTFVAIGITVAFVLTITLVPAYMVTLSDTTLAAMAARVHGGQENQGALARFLRKIPGAAVANSKMIVIGMLAIFALSGWGISKIVINDNPVNWFKKDHPIRTADRVLNAHFAGTYEAFLTLEYGSANHREAIEKKASVILASADENTKLRWKNLVAEHSPDGKLQLADLNSAISDILFEADNESLGFWELLANLVEGQIAQESQFQRPENIAYLEKIQQALQQSGYVGKSSGLPDLLKTVNRELHTGEAKDYTIPESSNAVAQAILTYQGSHNPEDVWHMVTPDYRSSVLWIQLRSGDNRDMSKVVAHMDQWFAANPPPAGMVQHWSGLTYINVVWQDAMVSGMLGSLLSSFVIVALMMIFLFRSIAWGLIAMLPLSITIAFIYGVIGFSGKNYDMPIAVLSALTLGMSVDFAIHFIERVRDLVAQHGSWEKGLQEVFEGPVRAISRNAIVIALGFTPLLLAPLVPYQTVGFFLAAIMAISCLVTLVVLPAVIHLLRNVLFPKNTI